jgi:hypothetical protein
VAAARWSASIVCSVFCSAALSGAMDFPGPAPGKPAAEVQGDQLRIGNQAVVATWSLAGGALWPVQVQNCLTGQTVPLGSCEAFRLTLADGAQLAASDLKVVGRPLAQGVAPSPAASILAERFAGEQLVVPLASTDGNLEVQWRAVLRAEANAIRQEITLAARNRPIPIQAIQLPELPGQNAQVVGTVPGSPIVVDELFFAYEHPDCQATVAERAACALKFSFSLEPGWPVTQVAALGAVPKGQLRRGFLYYVERERAHPYRPFLHYNSWYDAGWHEVKIREEDCLRVVRAFGEELIRKRGVPLASFVWDDGWDDPRTLWQPAKEKLPHGFAKVLDLAREYHSTLGFWLSPFGGYGKAKQERLALAKQQGFEIGPQGFSLAGPKYYARFRDVCLDFIRRDGANFFKFDGLARGIPETEAMLRLTRQLRAQKPDLFISITTGTWPSPFWLWYGDSTWRGGRDMGFVGPGSKREQWITYRDMETYRRVVKPAPLYPLNSLMNQGFAHAKYGMAAEPGSDPQEIRRELRSFFACGTCLQELYLSVEKMTPQNWDDLAECASWAVRNADVLVDTHWVGGDPGKGEVYGWASWSAGKGILALRNPTPQEAGITIDIGQAFDLPPDAPCAYTLKSPWKNDASAPRRELRAGEPRHFELAPFAVLVFEAAGRERD